MSTWQTDVNSWSPLLPSHCNIYTWRELTRKKGKARGVRRDGSGNERITTGCAENTSLEITVITCPHIYNETVSVFLSKASETKHVRAAINGHSWQTPSFGCLAAHQITWQAPKCIMALNGLAMTQGILTISWHSAFQCVFYGSSLWTLWVMMTIRHKCVCVRGDSWSG